MRLIVVVMIRETCLPPFSEEYRMLQSVVALGAK